MEKSYSISIILPAYNEEENIKKAIENSLSVLNKISIDYEVIVIDDGSLDDTKKISEEFQKKLKGKVRVISHVKNRGYASALRTGFSEANFNLVFFTDADNQFNMTELEEILKFIKDYDVVVGYRANRRDKVHRLILSQGYNFLIRILFGIKLKDVDCSFKLFKKEIIKNLEIKHEGWIVDTEIMAKIIKEGFKVKEIPVTHYPRFKGRSNVGFISILKTFMELVKLKIELIGE